MTAFLGGPLAAAAASTIVQQVLGRVFTRTGLPAETRDAIRDAVTREIEERGVDLAPIEDLAARAGPPPVDIRSAARPAVALSTPLLVATVVVYALLAAFVPETAARFLAGLRDMLGLISAHWQIFGAVAALGGGWMGLRTVEKIKGAAR